MRYHSRTRSTLSYGRIDLVSLGMMEKLFAIRSKLLDNGSRLDSESSSPSGGRSKEKMR